MSQQIIQKAALEWLVENTTIEVDLENPNVESLPARAQLFVEKFTEIMTRKTGVTSQSIEGLSLSFGGGDTSAAIWGQAQALLRGDLKSQVRFYPAKRKW